MTAGRYLRELAADQRRADQHGPAPPDTPTPCADVIRTASGKLGLWSLHARRLQRLKAPTVLPTAELEPPPLRRGCEAWPQAFRTWEVFDYPRELEHALDSST